MDVNFDVTGDHSGADTHKSREEIWPGFEIPAPGAFDYDRFSGGVL